MPSPRVSIGLTLLGFLGCLAPASAQTCQPEWLPTFGASSGVDGYVAASAIFDDGSGPALYVAGGFTGICGVGANAIARWNGTTWSPLSSGFQDLNTMAAVSALEVFDDGSGPALYAAGLFTSAGGVPANNVARWNGTSWTAVGAGLDVSPGGSSYVPVVSALAVYDDGSGAALYAGGAFVQSGGLPLAKLAKWNGASWSPVGGGTDGTVACLTVFDPGSGPQLFVGGGFSTAGGLAANNIARWNGTSWSALGTGIVGSAGYANVASLAVHDDGSGPALYVGGHFQTAGGVGALNVARWTGTSWSPLGSGIDGTPALTVQVLTLCVHDDGSGPALYAGGKFDSAGGAAAQGIARWGGSSWSGVGGGVDGPVWTLRSLQVGALPTLLAGGDFTAAGGQQASDLARNDSAGWHGFGSGIDGAVLALAQHDDGGGPALYAGGTFTGVGGTLARGIARWNGASWSEVGAGLQSVASVDALAVYDDGSGPALYAAGQFAGPGGSLHNIGKWDGVSWSALGGGLTLNAGTHIAHAYALVVHDDGTGPALYVGGNFSHAGGVPSNGVARWNGTGWSAVPGSSTSYSLAVFDAGAGPALYAGTDGYVKRWNGANWTWIPFQPTFSRVVSFAAFDDGTGPALYAGGSFDAANSVPALDIARFDGTNWSAVGSGMDGLVQSLAVHDDGGGPALYAGGWFTHAGGAAALGVARWDGATWSALGSSPTPRVVYCLGSIDLGSGASLLVGGTFPTSPAGDSYLARWGNPVGCGTPGIAICEPGVGGVSACPCGNPPAGSGRGCDNSSFTGGASLAASGIARLTFDSVVFTTSGETPTATSILVQGDALSSTGVVFGQGVRCVTGNLKRMYLKTAVAGSISAPSATDPHVHARSAALGDTIAPGSHRYYGVYYRDPIVLGGCPAASGFNITQQLDVLWAP